MRLDTFALDRLFRTARTPPAFRPDPVSDELLRELWELVRWGPTSGNCQPARLLFLRSAAAKERLRPALSPGNVAKVMGAPVTAILGYDTAFHDLLPRLWPRGDVRSWYETDAGLREETAFRNGTLQAAYLILAARALGLDCAPMSGFDAAAVDREFFAGTTIRANLLAALGYGAFDRIRPRDPRLAFDEACRVL